MFGFISSIFSRPAEVKKSPEIDWGRINEILADGLKDLSPSDPFDVSAKDLRGVASVVSLDSKDSTAKVERAGDSARSSPETPCESTDRSVVQIELNRPLNLGALEETSHPVARYTNPLFLGECEAPIPEQIAFPIAKKTYPECRISEKASEAEKYLEFLSESKSSSLAKLLEVASSSSQKYTSKAHGSLKSVDCATESPLLLISALPVQSSTGHEVAALDITPSKSPPLTEKTIVNLPLERNPSYFSKDLLLDPQKSAEPFEDRKPFTPSDSHLAPALQGLKPLLKIDQIGQECITPAAVLLDNGTCPLSERPATSVEIPRITPHSTQEPPSLIWATFREIWRITKKSFQNYKDSRAQKKELIEQVKPPVEVDKILEEGFRDLSPPNPVEVTLSQLELRPSSENDSIETLKQETIEFLQTAEKTDQLLEETIELPLLPKIQTAPDNGTCFLSERPVTKFEISRITPHSTQEPPSLLWSAFGKVWRYTSKTIQNYLTSKAEKKELIEQVKPPVEVDEILEEGFRDLSPPNPVEVTLSELELRPSRENGSIEGLKQETIEFLQTAAKTDQLLEETIDLPLLPKSQTAPDNGTCFLSERPVTKFEISRITPHSTQEPPSLLWSAFGKVWRYTSKTIQNYLTSKAEKKEYIEEVKPSLNDPVEAISKETHSSALTAFEPPQCRLLIKTDKVVNTEIARLSRTLTSSSARGHETCHVSETPVEKLKLFSNGLHLEKPQEAHPVGFLNKSDFSTEGVCEIDSHPSAFSLITQPVCNFDEAPFKGGLSPVLSADFLATQTLNQASQRSTQTLESSSLLERLAKITVSSESIKKITSLIIQGEQHESGFCEIAKESGLSTNRTAQITQEVCYPEDTTELVLYQASQKSGALIEGFKAVTKSCHALGSEMLSSMDASKSRLMTTGAALATTVASAHPLVWLGAAALVAGVAYVGMKAYTKSKAAKTERKKIAREKFKKTANEIVHHKKLELIVRKAAEKAYPGHQLSSVQKHFIYTFVSRTLSPSSYLKV